MKKKDLLDYRTKEIKDLIKLVVEKKLVPSKNSRREVAQILTIIKEKQLK
ncbi:MAG: hypothetical protein AAB535_02605 [Patescibacteria group bacterium]